jgi:hypothetical protein
MTTILERIETDIENVWNDYVLPEGKKLGLTVLGQIEQAAETYLSSGGSMTEAVASFVAQLPADLTALESSAVAYFASIVTAAQASAAGATPGAASQTPTPAAS